MSDVAKKLESVPNAKPGSRRNSLDLKVAIYDGRSSPKWVGTGDGYGEHRKAGSNPVNQQWKTLDVSIIKNFFLQTSSIPIITLINLNISLCTKRGQECLCIGNTRIRKIRAYVIAVNLAVS